MTIARDRNRSAIQIDAQARILRDSPEILAHIRRNHQLAKLHRGKASTAQVGIMPVRIGGRG